MNGLVVNKNADRFLVIRGASAYPCTARASLKKEGIFVGDKVRFDEQKAVIEEIYERKNLLVRPPIANLEKMVIVIAPKPRPDLYLVDKLILFCKINNITPILCVNKTDIDKTFFAKIKKIYNNVLVVVEASAARKETQSLVKHLSGICCFVGQSAVGKSSLLNALLNENKQEVGDLSKKTMRGKQTTRLVTIFRLGKALIADTAGFSKLSEEFIDIELSDIAKFNKDMLPFVGKCKYRSCLHFPSNHCAVYEAVKDGKISKERYENYIKLINFKQNQKKR